MVDTIDIPIARSGRDSLIAIACLWLLFVTVLSFRLWGRIRGPGLALDDMFAIVALVRSTYSVGVTIQSSLRVFKVLTTSTIGLNAAGETSLRGRLRVSC
jgi:hypothetical protein